MLPAALSLDLSGRSLTRIRDWTAAELDRPAGPVAAACLDAGLLVGTAGDTVLRLTPPLTIAREDVDTGLSLLAEVLG